MKEKVKILIFFIAFAGLVYCDESAEIDDKKSLIYWPSWWPKPNWTPGRNWTYPFHILKGETQETEIDEKKSTLHWPIWLPTFLPVENKKRETENSEVDISEKIYWPWHFPIPPFVYKRETTDETTEIDNKRFLFPPGFDWLQGLTWLNKREATEEEPEIEDKLMIWLPWSGWTQINKREAVDVDSPDDLVIEEAKKWWKKILPKQPVYVDLITAGKIISGIGKRETEDIPTTLDDTEAENHSTVDEKFAFIPWQWWRPIAIGKREAVHDGHKRRPWKRPPHHRRRSTTTTTAASTTAPPTTISSDE